MTTATVPPLRWRVHWVIAELDAHGEIDGHAAMCLRQAIDNAPAGTTEMVLVDLRDLTRIDTASLALLATHHAACHARGMEMAVLIGGHERHGQIAEALVLAGLGDTLHNTREACLPAPAPRVGASRARRRAGAIA